MDPTTHEPRNETLTESPSSQNGGRRASYTGLAGRLIIANLSLFLHSLVVFWRGDLEGPLGTPIWSGALAVLTVLLVLFYSVVLLIDRPARPSVRTTWTGLVLAMSLAAGLATYTFAPGYLRCYPLADAGFRSRYERPFREWAQGVLERPPGDLRYNGQDSPFLSNAEFPPWIKDLHRSPRLWSRVIRNPRDNGMFPPGSRSYVVIGWDADFMGWGLLIGPPDFRLPSGSADRFHAIAPGIYRW